MVYVSGSVMLYIIKIASLFQGTATKTIKIEMRSKPCMAVAYVCVLPWGFPPLQVEWVELQRCCSECSLLLWISGLHAACYTTVHCCHGNRVLFDLWLCDVYVKRERSGIYKCACLWFVGGGGVWGTQSYNNPSHPEPASLMPLLAPPPPACIAPKDLCRFTGDVSHTLSPVSHSEHVKPWITAHSRGTHTPECISSINVTRVFEQEKRNRFVFSHDKCVWYA